MREVCVSLAVFPGKLHAFACNEQNKSKEEKAKDDLSNETKGLSKQGKSGFLESIKGVRGRFSQSTMLSG